MNCLVPAYGLGSAQVYDIRQLRVDILLRSELRGPNASAAQGAHNGSCTDLDSGFQRHRGFFGVHR